MYNSRDQYVIMLQEFPTLQWCPSEALEHFTRLLEEQLPGYRLVQHAESLLVLTALVVEPGNRTHRLVLPCGNRTHRLVLHWLVLPGGRPPPPGPPPRDMTTREQSTQVLVVSGMSDVMLGENTFI